jgi:hypothetical protein
MTWAWCVLTLSLRSNRCEGWTQPPAGTVGTRPRPWVGIPEKTRLRRPPASANIAQCALPSLPGGAAARGLKVLCPSRRLA